MSHGNAAIDKSERRIATSAVKTVHISTRAKELKRVKESADNNCNKGSEKSGVRRTKRVGRMQLVRFLVLSSLMHRTDVVGPPRKPRQLRVESCGNSLLEIGPRRVKVAVPVGCTVPCSTESVCEST